MSKRRLPILIETSISAVQSLRTDIASKFEMKVRQVISKDGRTVTCSKGCASCCYHPVTISIFEGILIYRWLFANNQWTLKLKTRLKEVSEQQYGTSYEVWLLSLMPCPLLNEKNECSAYKARPLNCRTYYATSDPHYCHPHRLGEQTRIIKRDEPVKDFHDGQEALLRKHRLQFLTMPIGTAVLLAERICNDELRLDEIDRILFEEYVSKG